MSQLPAFLFADLTYGSATPQKRDLNSEFIIRNSELRNAALRAMR